MIASAAAMKRVLVLLLFFAAANAHAAVYLRLAAGTERSRGMTLEDRDCASTNPPALFGCGFGARGDFGRNAVSELGAGVERGAMRFELTFADRSSVDVEANSNFTGVSAIQPVRADGRSRALFATGAWMFTHAKLRPFLTAGAGLARNEIGAVRYSFPSIGANAVTITRGGSETSFAWMGGAGATFDISEDVALDLAWRYTDLGDVRTEAGTATIIRPTRQLQIDIAGTRAKLATSGITLAFRYRF